MARLTLEDRLFELLQDNFRQIKEDLANNTKKQEAGFRHIKHRLTKLEKEVFPDIPKNTQSLDPWYRDPKILRILTFLALALLLLVAMAAKIDISKFIT